MIKQLSTSNNKMQMQVVVQSTGVSMRHATFVDNTVTIYNWCDMLALGRNYNCPHTALTVDEFCEQVDAKCPAVMRPVYTAMLAALAEPRAAALRENVVLWINPPSL